MVLEVPTLGNMHDRPPASERFVAADATPPPVSDSCPDRVVRLLGRTRESGSAYAAVDYPAGYHQFVVAGEVFAGQRNPAQRLDLVPIDWTSRTVLDLGCNQGGMVFEALHRGATRAVGVDYDAHMVNAATKLSQWYETDNAHFFVHDLDASDNANLLDYLPDDKPDVIFLLSVCMWLDHWRALIGWTALHCAVLVFESNGSEAEQDAQVAELVFHFPVVRQLSKTSDDDLHQPHRRLFVCAHDKHQLL